MKQIETTIVVTAEVPDDYDEREVIDYVRWDLRVSDEPPFDISVVDVKAVREPAPHFQFALDHKHASVEFRDAEDEMFNEDDESHVRDDFVSMNYNPESTRALRRQIGPWQEAVINADGEIVEWRPVDTERWEPRL